MVKLFYCCAIVIGPVFHLVNNLFCYSYYRKATGMESRLGKNLHSRKALIKVTDTALS